MDALRLHIPKQMTEIKARDLLFISRLFVIGYTEKAFLTLAFLKLSNLKLIKNRPPADDGSRWYAHHSRKKPVLIEPHVFHSMTENCRFLLSPGEIRPKKWIGFARARHYRLYNACFEEYLMAENFYFAYVKTNDERHLDNLISVLYRKPWQKWDAAKIMKRSGKFRKSDPAIKNLLFMWYVGFREYLSKRCKNLFSGDGGSASFDPRKFISGVVHQLTNGVITERDRLLQSSAIAALDELEVRAEEIVKQMERNKKR